MKKIQDGALSNINDYSYGGPQFAYTNGPLFMAGEWMYVTTEKKQLSQQQELQGLMEITRQLVVHFLRIILTGGTTVPLSAKKGKIGGVKCKGKFGCTAVKVMYEQWNGAHSTTGTDAKVIHFGLNHYFNNNVRLMIDGARGLYIKWDWSKLRCPWF